MSREDDGGKAAPARQEGGYWVAEAFRKINLCRARAFLADSGSIGSCGAVGQGGSGKTRLAFTVAREQP